MPNYDIRRVYGLTVAHHRRLAALTPAELAEQAGLTESYVALVEAGTASADIRDAQKLAVALRNALADTENALPLTFGAFDLFTGHGLSAEEKASAEATETAPA